MGHYWHCCRVRAVTKSDAIASAEHYIETQVERQTIDYGYIMAVTDENGVISIEDRDYQNCAEEFSLEKLRNNIVDRLPDLSIAVDKLKELVSKMTVSTAKDEVDTLNNMVFDLSNSVSDEQRKSFDVFKDTAYPLQLLEYGLTDLTYEGYDLTPADVPESDKHTFFVWVNSHF